ncbi:MAG: hypothetical protein C3F13_11505 [Anaerolineales bacterium]|nr:hypothetical protein [Anaerolineae bacterium]PWB52383.1 MAG: hypothetical protein C3F13_11505 [Anaerolineales bacterium]
MERTVPSTASEEVELYLRTYYSLLRSSADVQIRTLEEAHAGMKSLLHPMVREAIPDMSAFLYCLLRLPACISMVESVVLGQSIEVFNRAGFKDIETWELVSAPARRRKCYFNGNEVLACFIASVSDIDDVIPMLTAYQIEWNKIHWLLSGNPSLIAYLKTVELENEYIYQELCKTLNLPREDIERLKTVWADMFIENLLQIANRSRKIKVRLLNGSMVEYRRATDIWWEGIAQVCEALNDRPVYFISSNPHSMINLLSGYAFRNKKRLIDFLQETDNRALLEEWENIQAQQVASSEENFLYYILKKFQQTSSESSFVKEQQNAEADCGILRFTNEHSFDVDAQIIEIRQICPDTLDPRLVDEDLSFLGKSDAILLNIDYPLGMAAYNILSEVSEHVVKVLGIYIMGKSASLNGTVGDVVIPNVVHDEHSMNTYLFKNCFTAAHVSPYLMYGAVLDNQKCVSVRGTFLQNSRYMEVFYREGYTDIEMEAGPYLSAVYEMYRPQRHPVNEIVNLYEVPFDTGIIHYVSDNPLGKGKNLGAGSLSYYGMDSTYAASVAILRRIFQLERARLAE